MPKIVSKGIINSASTLPATRKQPLRHKTIVRSTSSTSKDSSEPPSEATAKRKAGTEEIVSSPNRQPLPTLHPKLGHLIFQDFPDFTPNLTPKQVIQAGSFGGTYFRNIKSGVTGLSYTTKQVLEDLPKDWFEGLTTKHYASQTYNDSINTYKASCGGDLNMWESSGWIRECDPYGWFQWYCRFYLGRRCSDDNRQIARALGVMGPKGRWRNNLINKILLASTTTNSDARNDFSISPKIRQLLQHWGYKITAHDLAAAAKKR